ncbi:hypothetical protein HYALB_00013330 [Hymenoscyphus albidus]|uniref:Uncharacterized protein n=1 Tax=Hymenoscyphus albidus TaxID=595503 RepID=A0A9N9LV08_9HELO|nr:hypothetical protein HYALB_00013330 [Hymenoscyphus albidus]
MAFPASTRKQRCQKLQNGQIRLVSSSAAPLVGLSRVPVEMKLFPKTACIERGGAGGWCSQRSEAFGWRAERIGRAAVDRDNKPPKRGRQTLRFAHNQHKHNIIEMRQAKAPSITMRAPSCRPAGRNPPLAPTYAPPLSCAATPDGLPRG